MPQPTPPGKTRQTLPTPSDKLFDTDPPIFISIEVRKDFGYDDLAFRFHSRGVGDFFLRGLIVRVIVVRVGLLGMGQVEGVVEPVNRFDLGGGEVVVPIQVVEATDPE